MKKLWAYLLCLILALSLAGCGDSSKTSRTDQNQRTVDDVLEEGINTADKPEEAAQNVVEDNSEKEEPKPAEGVDVDLTVLSRTLIYSEIANMLTAPDEYKGKIIKMKGECMVYCDPDTKQYYFACFVRDAAACCQNGIEFVLPDGAIAPDDYPKDGENITVTGTFDTYEENGQLFCTLRNAVVS